MGTRRKLLLADDSITIQKVVNLTFVDEGFDVITVGNGNLAIEKIEELVPDIVLADIHMPRPNGYEVCEFVKRSERFRHIPVMLLVGSFEPFDEAEARRVGADDHLTKPFQSIRELVSRIGALLSGTSSEDERPTIELEKGEDSQQKAHVRPEAAQPVSSPEPPGAETLDPVAFTSEVDGAYSDPSLDDAMIEAVPVQDLNLDRAIESSRATTPLSLPSTDRTAADRNLPPTIHTQDTLRMQESDFVVEGSSAPIVDVRSQARTATSVATDDVLLDLGDDEPQLTTVGREDFILDIFDEAPARVALSSSAPADSPIVQYDGVVTEDSTSRAESVAAAVLEAEPISDSIRAVNVKSETVPVEPVVDGQTTSQRTGLITLDQLSPEVIDAVARRAVEQLSEKVVEQIAWEVVPELAERLIKQRLEKEDEN